MNENKHFTLLSEAPVPKALLKLGIPTMIGMMVSSLYNLVDTYFVGTLGTSQQAAVSAVFPVSLVCYARYRTFVRLRCGQLYCKASRQGRKRSH